VPFLLINPRSGRGGPSAEELAAEAAAAGVETRILRKGDDAVELARAAPAEALGVAGGDGSLAPVAAVALERELPFVCVPFGTRNHFAGDLGLDRRDPLGALAAFSGVERRIDVGRVNGRVFLNNVSLGVYARLVHRREEHRRRREALAGLRAAWLLARDRHRLRASVDGERVAARIVLVANNEYELDLFTLGARTRLDAGRLWLYAADGWLPRDWSSRGGERFGLELAGPVHAAADGEPIELEPPLRFEILPQALRVLLPAESR
jgi:diacylglycerol kinase family enzyme